ncbi:ABC transporter permease subunit [Acidaminobacter sp. JC074]|uniref:carbohydrate ABC transporter permease n=1 Tax=Acidaminobacter sp. JC074 TaxID=2530199 RepID=UPI001F0E631C|nr:sugar ABC transporter permease [Acidaminobacter sp. JC074]MCH4889204.1 ABC transporter permease subunit [Acidaminobacter sp. JC074]
MARYNVYLYDEIGNEYERKNLYLKEVAILEEKIQEGSGNAESLKETLKTLKAGKKNHPYIKKLNDYHTEEKAFKASLREKVTSYKKRVNGKYSRKVLKLQVDLLRSKEALAFYKNYVSLDYDAELKYEEARIMVDQLAEIVETMIQNENRLKEALADGKKIKDSDEAKAKQEFNDFKADQQRLYDEGCKALVEKRNKGLISKKALNNEKGELKKKMDEALTVKSYDSPKKSNKELIGNIKYQLSKGLKRDLNVMHSNISDYRRKTPVELNKKTPIHAYFTWMLPGVGQLLNKQYIKSLFFFVLSAFMYFAAIPYALGFGNYQGQGIAGLVTLAEGGRKIDRSLIFMIEGIMALFLVMFVVAIVVISFKDVLSIEKKRIKGTRQRNWFETWANVTEEGFPYMVSMPALVAVVFIVLVPITTAILLSFTNLDPDHQNKFQWIGIDNYRMIALGEGVAGGPFWQILGWTLTWTLVATTLAITIGFMLALIVNNERVYLKPLWRSVFILPWAVPAFITIMFFSIMFSQNGILTTHLNTLLHSLNLIGVDEWLVVKNDPFWSRVTLIGLQGWLGSAYVFLLSTGVLQAIPADLYEAAQIDGATAWQKLRRITLPIVLFQTAPLLVGQYTFNFNNFSIIYLFNGGGPFNPTKYGNLAGSTDLLISYIYKLTMENDYQAIGAAITIVISIGLMLFAFIGFKNSKAFKEEKL